MRDRALVALAVSVLIGCSAPLAYQPLEAPTPSAVRALPTTAPAIQVATPTPDPGPTQEQLAAACSGLAVTSAALYSGKTHPLVVINEEWGDYVDSAYAINKKWISGAWPSTSIQLVVCAPYKQDASEKVRSCGRWKRQSDGVYGRLFSYRYKMKIRVVAATAKTLQSTTLYGSAPGCYSSKYSSLDLSRKPPWKMYGSVLRRSWPQTPSAVGVAL
jgi:hypothetical protein